MDNNGSAHGPVAIAEKSPFYKMFWAGVMLTSGTLTTLTAKVHIEHKMAQPNFTHTQFIIIRKTYSLFLLQYILCLLLLPINIINVFIFEKQ
jgi:uncharacterized membrane protein